MPGGHVEMGETLHEAIVREVLEETGLEVVVDRYLGYVERMGAEPDNPDLGQYHFVILDFAVTVLDPTQPPVAGDDAAEVAWVPTGEVSDLRLVQGVYEFLTEFGVLEVASRAVRRVNNEVAMSTSPDCTALRDAAQQLVDDGLPACQVAVARDRELVMFETFGDASDTTRFRVASSTKPIVGSAILHLIGDGKLDIDARVVDYIPEFGTHGKDVITVEQLMVFSCGFPRATLPSRDGADRVRRVERFAEWELDWEPGTAFEYHPGAAHWVMAELIDRLGGVDFLDFIEQRVTQPLDLPRLLGFGPGDAVRHRRAHGCRREPARRRRLRARRRRRIGSR